MQPKDPLEEALEKVGIHLEKKPDVSPITQMLSSGLGGIAGSVVGGLAGLGPIGKAVSGLAGAVLGHVFSTYHVRLVPPKSEGETESPMAWSDRR
jgi:hypothetical protein